ncbi:MAG TPA: HEAT repeat domain-containing protein [Pirellulales bacterium]|nr:HEAT repeat domain-containing protein [Pirellulales bacterium]
MRYARTFAIFSCVALTAVMVRAADGQTSAEKEKELLALLRSDASKADKALACKKLAVYGSSEAVPELARLLTDEELASWARIPLEAIPGPAADEALRKALDSLQGNLLVGAINSIGVRRDSYAADALISRLKDKDADVASAAAAALGRIANDAAITALRKSLPATSGKVRSAVAEGLVLCAERLMTDGRTNEAVEIYDQVRKAEVPKQRMLEATRGAILARKEQGIALLLEQLRSPEKALFQLALGTAREIPSRTVDEALAKELPNTSPPRAALIVVAMADRKDMAALLRSQGWQDLAADDTVTLPTMRQAAAHGPKEVRLAAIEAIGRVGDGSCLNTLLTIATDSDPELSQAAKTALSELRGDSIDREIATRLAKTDDKLYPVLIEVVGERRLAATPALVKALDSADPAVRQAALKALGETVSANEVNILVRQAVSPKHADDAPAAQQALKAAAVRMPDREACAAELAASLDAAPSATKPVLLDILAAVGGTKALAAVGAAAKSSDPELQDASSRLLGEWMTADAAPVLLDLSKTAPGEKFQARALRGYIRIARQFVLPDDERLAMCQSALDACRQPAEKKLVLEVLKRYPSQQTLALAIKLMQVPELKADATQTALAIAQKVGNKVEGVQKLLTDAGLGKVKVEIVKAEYGAGATQKDVTEVLRKQLADVQLIGLPADDYNSSFGGDPVPGTPKQLKIQYRIDGKPGEATFAENALIILPMPK